MSGLVPFFCPLRSLAGLPAPLLGRHGKDERSSRSAVVISETHRLDSSGACRLRAPVIPGKPGRRSRWCHPDVLLRHIRQSGRSSCRR